MLKILKSNFGAKSLLEITGCRGAIALKFLDSIYILRYDELG
ncbi:MAG: hypothetical protein SAJ72_23095 [Jaaginema sp. PMC 1080.18]|nr:hypothetical protein [Jaaginema sp. PMC 1080.18]